MVRFRQLPFAARLLVAAVSATGATAAAGALAVSSPVTTLDALAFVALTVVAGLVRVPLPVFGSLSLAYAFVFAAFLEYGLGTSVLASVASGLVSSIVPFRRSRRPPWHRIGFNGGLVALSSSLAGGAWLAMRGASGVVDPLHDPLPLIAYTATFVTINLGLISWAIHLSGTDRVATSLRANALWSLPGFVAGSCLAVLIAALLADDRLSWIPLALPFAALVHVAYRSRVTRAEEARRHSAQSAELYRSVAEALAVAMEAKDEGTEEHLRRVQRMATGVGERMGLRQEEMEALAAGALLHDIGKIAVPETILNKPGRLTAEETERIRSHVRVGANILEAVPFPYPLAPIVRHHHERWDGRGYPDGLSGESIPVGARILSVVDCYDALTSNRPYRAALPRDEVVDFLRKEAGTAFDPSVVAALVEDLDRLDPPSDPPGVPHGETGAPAPVVDGGMDPHDGATDAPPWRAAAYREIRDARREMEELYDIARTLGRELDLDEGLAIVAPRIDRLVPHRTLAVYVPDRSQNRLVARFVTGQGSDRIRGLAVPLGERVAGWAAQYQQPYVGRSHQTPVDRDGSRSDLEDLAEDAEVAELTTSLVVPLRAGDEAVGVLALYDGDERRFGPNDRRRAIEVAGWVARLVRDARRRERSVGPSLTDSSTGVPNSRFFLLEAEHRMGLARESGGSVGLLAVRIERFEDLAARLGSRGADRVLGATARILASACRERETLVRFGRELFLVLVRPGANDLRERAEALGDTVRRSPVEARLGATETVTCTTAWAAFPADGSTLEEILDVLEHRLAETGKAGPGVIVPFPDGRGVSS